MATPSHFQIINKNQFFKINKNRACHRVGNAWVEMRGAQNGDSTGDCLEGQAWTWDEANMAFDESISGYSLLDCTLRVPEFSLGTLTWLIVLVDYLDWRFWHSDFLCASSIYLFEIFDMLIILIDHFILLSALILILPWLFWSLHMHTLTAVHHSTGYVVFSDWHIILIVFWAWCSYRYSSW